MSAALGLGSRLSIFHLLQFKVLLVLVQFALEPVDLVHQPLVAARGLHVLVVRRDSHHRLDDDRAGPGASPQVERPSHLVT